MKKFLVLILLILFSCEKDELVIVEPEPQYEMIFEETSSLVKDGQEFSFEINYEETHCLLVVDKHTGSVISKEIFLPTMGINTKIIYTKALPKEELRLILLNSKEEISTNIIIE